MSGGGGYAPYTPSKGYDPRQIALDAEIFATPAYTWIHYFQDLNKFFKTLSDLDFDTIVTKLSTLQIQTPTTASANYPCGAANPGETKEETVNRYFQDDFFSRVRSLLKAANTQPANMDRLGMVHLELSQTPDLSNYPELFKSYQALKLYYKLYAETIAACEQLRTQEVVNTQQLLTEALRRAHLKTTAEITNAAKRYYNLDQEWQKQYKTIPCSDPTRQTTLEEIIKQRDKCLPWFSYSYGAFYAQIEAMKLQEKLQTLKKNHNLESCQLWIQKNISLQPATIAATTIQALWRGHLARKIQKQKKETAATKIQALYRGHLARRKIQAATKASEPEAPATPLVQPQNRPQEETYSKDADQQTNQKTASLGTTTTPPGSNPAPSQNPASLQRMWPKPPSTLYAQGQNTPTTANEWCARLEDAKQQEVILDYEFLDPSGQKLTTPKSTAPNGAVGIKIIISREFSVSCGIAHSQTPAAKQPSASKLKPNEFQLNRLTGILDTDINSIGNLVRLLKNNLGYENVSINRVQANWLDTQLKPKHDMAAADATTAKIVLLAACQAADLRCSQAVQEISKATRDPQFAKLKIYFEDFFARTRSTEKAPTLRAG